MPARWKFYSDDMDETTLSLIQQKIGYQFTNPVLLKQAFVSPSLSAATQNRVQNYQILEFIGDAVLGLAVVKNLASGFCLVLLRNYCDTTK